MGFTEAVRVCVLQKYATFDGRAMRSEFWYFALFTVLAGIVASILDSIIFPRQIAIISTALNLALLFPSIAVTARRLHDVDRSGWWQLINLTVIGILLILYWAIQPGNAGTNKYGPPPTAATVTA